MNNTQIPFLDLVTPHRELEAELVEVFRQALRAGMFIGGPQVEAFEKEFAAFCDAKHCVGVGSGTDALRFALIAAGVRPGDLVVTVSNTFIATTEAVSQAGAGIVFVDVDRETYTLDPERLRRFLSEQCIRDASGRTVHRDSNRPVKAVVPVHLYGQIADMDPILELAREHGLVVIEDACQAHGAEYHSRAQGGWKKAGSLGAAAAFSFYPGKNLGACGEGGAITTNDEEIARTCRMLRDHGQVRKYVHEFEGYNGRLDAVQAGILRIKLRHLAEWNRQRSAVAAQYRELLAGLDGLALPAVPEWSRPVHHLFVVRHRERDRLQTRLQERNIATAFHYPVPLHFQKAYAAGFREQGDLTVSEEVCREVLSLPMYPGLSRDAVLRVAEAVREFTEEARPFSPAAQAEQTRRIEEAKHDPAAPSTVAS